MGLFHAVAADQQDHRRIPDLLRRKPAAAGRREHRRHDDTTIRRRFRVWTAARQNRIVFRAPHGHLRHERRVRPDWTSDADQPFRYERLSWNVFRLLLDHCISRAEPICVATRFWCQPPPDIRCGRPCHNPEGIQRPEQDICIRNGRGRFRITRPDSAQSDRSDYALEKRRFFCVVTRHRRS
jgi:hypothetical protein